MRLDRNVNQDGKGKYALLNLRKNTVEWGRRGEEDEFFVIKLKDKYAAEALRAYAAAADRDGETEYALEILRLATFAASSPWTKKPD